MQFFKNLSHSSKFMLCGLVTFCLIGGGVAIFGRTPNELQEDSIKNQTIVTEQVNEEKKNVLDTQVNATVEHESDELKDSTREESSLVLSQEKVTQKKATVNGGSNNGGSNNGGSNNGGSNNGGSNNGGSNNGGSNNGGSNNGGSNNGGNNNGEDNNGGGQTPDEVIPTFENASVHDPSVIKVDGTYYVFGSHLAAASSDDLINWTQLNTHVQDENTIIPNVYTELAELFEWAQTDTLWAADVIQLKDGRYYMYYNSCKGDSPRSAIGIAVSDSVVGPYKDEGLFLYSGMWGEISHDGTIYDAKKHPNAVDPHVFFDKDNKLWMVYGSYSGGIFILEMDEETGLPLEGQGYGKKLFGGQHLRIEGVYMQYSPQTDYYYLFMSFGGLDTTGGYNLRVARSKTPNGEFVDASGKKLSDAVSNSTYFDDAAIEPYGNKVMGNFNFTNFNASEDFIDYGYVSSGHNSTYYEAKTDQYFNIFHTRFPNRGEEHEVRVHQMFMNQDDWLVVTPHRYTGETIKPVKQKDIVGAYHYINHAKDISATIKPSQYIMLNKDGSISGAVQGTYEIVDDYFAEITVLENNQPNVYKGVFIKQWDESQSQYVMSFTALSNDGITIWGSQIETIDADQLLQNILNNTELIRSQNLYEDIVLPSIENPTVTSKWTSSNEAVLSSTGKVVRPKVLEADEVVTLTLTVSVDGKSKSKIFEYTIKAQTDDLLSDALTAYYPFENHLQDSQNDKVEALVIGDKIGVAGGEITYKDGVLGQGAYFNGATGLQLPNGLIQSQRYTVSLYVKPEVISQFSPAFFGAVDDSNWVSFVPSSWDQNIMVWTRSSERWYDGITGYKMSSNKWTHLAFSVDDETLIVYVDGQVAFIGENYLDLFNTQDSVFTLGVNYWDAAFKGMMDELRIYETALDADVVHELANQVSLDLTSGLVASYRFDQNLDDATQNVASGTVLGDRINKPSTDSLSFTEGIKGDAVVFDGSHGIRLPNNLISSDTYSVSLWLSPEKLTDYTPSFFGMNSLDDRGDFISLLPKFRETDPSITLWAGSSRWFDGLTKFEMPLNEWTHVVFTVDSSVLRVYVNGIEQFKGTNFPDQFSNKTSQFALGVNYWDVPYQGKMDELNIYNIALSAAQVKALAGTTEEPEVVKTTYTYPFENNLDESKQQLEAGAVTNSKLADISNDSLSFTNGVKGQALVLDGSHGVKLPKELITTNQYSISLWLNPNELTTNTTAFFGAKSPEQWLSLVPKGWNGDTMLWAKNNNEWYDGLSKQILSLNEWSHLSITNDDGELTLYLNGQVVFAGQAFPDLFSGLGGDFGLGVNYWDTPFKGLMDELNVSNYVLTADEIKALASIEPSEPEVEKIEYTYKFDNDLGETTQKLEAAKMTSDRLHLLSTDEAVFADGVRGSAIVFDGSHGVRLPDGLIKSNTFTISLWVNPFEKYTHTPTFFGAASLEDWISILPNAWDNTATLWASDNNVQYYGPSQKSLPANAWSHLTVSVNNGVVIFYIDGKECFTGTTFPDIFTDTFGEFGLGVNYWDKAFKGLMDELSVYNYVLTAQEIKNHYDSFGFIQSEIQEEVTDAVNHNTNKEDPESIIDQAVDDLDSLGEIEMEPLTDLTGQAE